MKRYDAPLKVKEREKEVLGKLKQVGEDFYAKYKKPQKTAKLKAINW
ncbi:MAG: hypothetical protein WC444_05810 [Candidatus Paceibacterota bacterium]